MKNVQGFILFLVAVVMSFILLPFLFLSSLFLCNVNDYLFMIALSIDQLGNVIGGPLFNYILIKENIYEFGDPDDTISYVLGRNEAVGNLSLLGKLIVWCLNIIDPGHTQMAVLRAVKLRKRKIIKNNNEKSCIV